MERLPAVFFAHGSPMSALGGDSHAAALRAFGQRHTTARAILVVSAHWQVSQPVRTSHTFLAIDPKRFLPRI